jgi:hypothetical protein
MNVSNMKFNDMTSLASSDVASNMCRALFTGFLITPSKMGALKFVYYISLFAYSLRSLCQNEFLSR